MKWLENKIKEFNPIMIASTGYRDFYLKEYDTELEQLIIQHSIIHSQLIAKDLQHVRYDELQKFVYYHSVWQQTYINQTHLTKLSGDSLDHIIPISYGYHNSINPEIIGSKDNLQILPIAENMRKGARITDEALDLLIKFGVKEKPRHLYNIIENKTMSGYTYKKKRESGDGCIRFYTATSERELIDVIRYR